MPELKLPEDMQARAADAFDSVKKVLETGDIL